MIGDGIHTGRVIHTQFTGDSRELHVLPANEDILRVVHCVSLNGIIHATLVIAIAWRIHCKPQVLGQRCNLHNFIWVVWWDSWANYRQSHTVCLSTRRSYTLAPWYTQYYIRNWQRTHCKDIELALHLVPKGHLIHRLVSRHDELATQMGWVKGSRGNYAESYVDCVVIVVS